jgi:hypothetical protein
MLGLGRMMISVGALLVVAGALLLLASRFGLPLGRLPGDFSWRGRNMAIYFPLGTSLLLSILLSLFFYIVGHFRR